MSGKEVSIIICHLKQKFKDADSKNDSLKDPNILCLALRTLYMLLEQPGPAESTSFLLGIVKDVVSHDWDWRNILVVVPLMSAYPTEPSVVSMVHAISNWVDQQIFTGPKVRPAYLASRNTKKTNTKKKKNRKNNGQNKYKKTKNEEETKAEPDELLELDTGKIMQVAAYCCIMLHRFLHEISITNKMTLYMHLIFTKVTKSPSTPTPTSTPEDTTMDTNTMKEAMKEEKDGDDEKAKTCSTHITKQNKKNNKNNNDVWFDSEPLFQPWVEIALRWGRRLFPFTKSWFKHTLEPLVMAWINYNNRDENLIARAFNAIRMYPSDFTWLGFDLYALMSSFLAGNDEMEVWFLICAYAHLKQIRLNESLQGKSKSRYAGRIPGRQHMDWDQSIEICYNGFTSEQKKRATKYALKSSPLNAAIQTKRCVVCNIGMGSSSGNYSSADPSECCLYCCHDVCSRCRAPHLERHKGSYLEIGKSCRHRFILECKDFGGQRCLPRYLDWFIVAEPLRFITCDDID